MITAVGSYRSSVFHDKDGSVGGVPDSFIFVNSGTAAAAANDNCRIEETWGARVCKGDYVRQTVGAGGRGGGRGGGPGAGRGGPGGAGGPGGGRGGAPGTGAPRGGNNNN